VNRIFLVLASIGNAAFVLAVVLGWYIGDPASAKPEVQDGVALHILVAMGAAILVLLVHAVALTYFMGTGRWIEETCAAYSLGDEPRKRNMRLKYRILPGMMLAVLLVMLTGALGAVADPSSDYSMANSSTWHLALALATLVLNLIASGIEYYSIRDNSDVVNQIVQEVRRIRTERGLDND